MTSGGLAWRKRIEEGSQRALRMPALRQGGWLLVVSVLAGILDYVANASMGRLLGPADYSVYAALLSLFATLTSLTRIVQTTVTNYTARLVEKGNLSGLRGITLSSLRWLILAGIVVCSALALSTGLLSDVLQIAAPQPIWALAVAVIPLSLTPLVMGLLRGYQKFGAFGGATLARSAARLVGGLILVYLGAGVTGAVASLGLAALAMVFVGAAYLPEVWRRWGERSVPQVDGVSKFVFSVTLGTLAYALLTGMDVLVVKNRFSPVDAGLYASVSTVGRTALWITLPLITLLLPKAAAHHARGEDTSTLVRRALAATVVLGGSVTLVFVGLSTPIMNFLYGAQYLALAGLLGPMGLVMTLYSMVGIWFNYFLGVERVSYSWYLAIGVLAQACVLLLFCDTVEMIVWAMAATGFLLVVAAEGLYRYSRRRA